MTEPLPMEGIKVADFTWAIAGPTTTKYLAMFGATVVKIESHSRLDSSRLGPPFMGKPSRNSGAMWANYSASKMSISLNLKLPQAQDVARRMAGWADIAIENFSAGQMAEWGLDYENLRKVNPRLIMLSSSQQGQTGPFAPHPGLGGLLQALGGINHVTGWPDREPRAPDLPMPDLIAPWYNLMAIIGALEVRDRTGQGRYLDVSQLEVTLQALAPSMLDYAVNGRVGGRRGNFSHEAAPHNAYRCRGDDVWCAISVTTDEEWRAFCRVLGEPAWAREPRFATLLARLRHVDDLDALVTSWTEQREPDEVMRLMQEAGVPAGVVATGKELIEDPQLQSRGHFVTVDYPGRGSVPVDGPSFRITGLHPKIQRAPDLGQHTERVCKEFLGMPQAEYDQLQAQGVFA